MNFILVNGRTPRRETFCLQCCEAISLSYLREMGTQLPYCSYECYARHRNLAAREQTRVESGLIKGVARNSKGS